ncbi:MAG: DMT family transporter [Gammaproteobacteria bacterium]|nr:DMT family transporter [Gammaproteobacteria bacterium]
MLRIALLTLLTMLAFAGNSVLCRLALKETAIDAASFTSVRLLSGAVVLFLITRLLHPPRSGNGSWGSAFALFVYAAAFSFAYIQLDAATGALLLFGAVQVSMIGYGLWSGERLAARQVLGLVAALAGLTGLLLPGLHAPPLVAATLMLSAGIAWGVYSIRGRGAGDPTRVTTGNFLRAVPMALGLSALVGLPGIADLSLDTAGLGFALASGALTSGLGYALWYRVLPSLQSTHAATVQLSVPVITAIAGVLLLEEPITLRLVLASLAVLGGIALVIAWRPDGRR